MDDRRGHTNPDGTSVPTPHVHLFREGFDDKFAYPLNEVFPEFDTQKHDRVELFFVFCDYCNIARDYTIENSIGD